MLKDGSRVESALKSCDDESCSIDGRRIALEEVARIELADEPLVPRAVRGAAAMLTDGTVVRGRFVGLSSGYVWIGDEEIERERVAVIALADSLNTSAADVLVSADATQRSGALDTCNVASCTFEEETVPWASIRWLGLQQEGKSPPIAVTSDQIFFDDAPPLTARATTIDAVTVKTTRGSFPRENVTWIFIAAPAATTDVPAGGGTAQEQPPEAPEPPVQPAQPPAPPSTPPPPPSPPVQPPAALSPPASASPPAGGGTRGPLWTGTIRARAWGLVDETFSDLSIDVDVRLREYIHPMLDVSGRKIGTTSTLVPEGSTIRNSIRCTSRWGGCSGSGSVSVPDASGGLPSAIYHLTADVPMPAMFGFALDRGRPLYFAAVAAPPGAQYDVTYWSTGSSTSPSGFICPVVGRSPTGPRVVQFEDPELRYIEGGRMIGSYTAPATGAFEQIAVSWSICREGVQCPQAPELPDDAAPPPAGSTPGEEEEPADCDELAGLIGRMRALRELADGYHRDLREAEQQRDAARDQIWGADGALKDYFTSMLELAAKGASAALAKVIGYATTLMGMSGEGNLSDVNKAVKQLGYGPQDLLMDAAAKEGVRAAVQRADAYLRQTGDHQGALRLYAGSIQRSEDLQKAAKNVTKGIGIATAVADYAQKTNALFDLIDQYRDANEATTRAQTNIDDVNEQIEELQKRIDTCRGTTSVLPRPRPRHRESNEIHLVRYPPQSGGSASASDKLRSQHERLQQVPAQLEAATIWLLPFALDLTDGVDPRLLAGLLTEAQPHLEEIRGTIDDSLATGQSLEGELENEVPKTDASRGQSVSEGDRGRFDHCVLRLIWGMPSQNPAGYIT